MFDDWLMGLGLVLTSTITAGLGAAVVHLLGSRTRRPPVYADFHRTEEAVFLFDGENLLDASSAARALMASISGKGAVWTRLMVFLTARFPDVGTALMRLPSDGRISLISDPGSGEPLLLTAELRGGLTRLTLQDPDAERSQIHHDPISYRAQLEELAMLRNMVGYSPVPIWRQTATGEVTWTNQAYLNAAAIGEDGQAEAGWPLPRLFDALASERPEAGQRQRLTHDKGAASWFDLHSFPEGQGRICFALPADATVQAENVLRDFMQTLTKTFAQLQIGLAIFDSSRKLQVFNPALLDLTGLPIDFLSSRPSILAVLDGMRERNMIPEPRDYRSWRRQLLELERASADGHFEETWSLPGGQTYRVVGRPHPNGALALIIEDISTEITRTRRFKADLELGQAVLDRLAEGIAVISPSGQVVMTNTAYAAIWGHDPCETVGAVSVGEICAYWRARSAASPLWAQIETYVSNPGDRLIWLSDCRLEDGRLLDCTVSPLQGGATLVRFSPFLQVQKAVPPAEHARAEDEQARAMGA